MTSKYVRQYHFVEVDDDGAENAATLGTIDQDWDQDVDSNKRVRFQVSETNSKQTGAFTLKAQCRLYTTSWGSWQDITTTSSIVKAVTSGYVTDSDPTTERMAGAQNFVTGEWSADGSFDDSFQLDGEDTEMELCFQIVSADVADGNLVEMRPEFLVGADDQRLLGFALAHRDALPVIGTPSHGDNVAPALAGVEGEHICRQQRAMLRV